MNKKFWLVCITASPWVEGKEPTPPCYRLFRVSTNNYFDVTVPLNTLAYGFIETDESEEEVLSKIVSLNSNRTDMISKFDILSSVMDKLYVPGQVLTLPNGNKIIINADLGTAVMCTEKTIPI